MNNTNFVKKNELHEEKKMLRTNIITHTFQHIIFDRFKFTLDSSNLYVTHLIWWNSCELCVGKCLAEVPLA